MFKTWSPCERSAPYHEWLLHEMRFLCKERQGLATLEALHLAHIMIKMFREWIAGGSMKRGRNKKTEAAWHESQCFATGAVGKRVRVNFAGRLEYQDGSRKEAPQDYHGRGAVHLRGLIFAESTAGMQWESIHRATVPPQTSPLGLRARARAAASL